MIKLLYFLLLIGAGVFAVLYADVLSFILFAALIILPVFLLVQLIISAFFIKCEALNEKLTAYKGQPCEAAFRISNRSIFPVHCRVRIKTVISPQGGVARSEVNIPVGARSEEIFSLNLGCEHCCKGEFYVESVQLYDVIRLFSVRRIKNQLHCRIFVIPKADGNYRDEAESILRAKPESFFENDISCDKAGSSGDVCGFREFVPGDRLSLIHYKLSARFDKDIVKQFSAGGSPKLLLTADLSGKISSERDDMLETLLGTALELYRMGAEAYMAVPLFEGTAYFLRCEPLCTEGLAALRLSEESDCIAAVCAMCGGSLPAAENEKDFMMCSITDFSYQGAFADEKL